jgi:hypothetical protein
MTRRVAVALVAVSIAACGALADLDGLSDGPPEIVPTEAASPAPVDPPQTLRDADAAVVFQEDASGSGIVTVDVDGFETALDCDGWVPVNSTAEPVDGGYTGARSCLVCRSGDMYMDKDVRLPGVGTVGVDLWVKRRSDTPAGTSMHLNLNVRGANQGTSVTLTDTWTRVLLAIEAPEAGSLGMRISSEPGCFFLDDVRVRLDPY